MKNGKTSAAVIGLLAGMGLFLASPFASAQRVTTTVSVGTNPHAVAMNPVTNKIYIANYSSNNVTVIDGATNSTTTVSAGTNPSAVAVDTVSNKIYVANNGSANVTVIDGATNATTVVSAGTNPSAVAVNPLTNKIYVANNGSANVTVINGATNATATVSAGTDPSAVAVNPVSNEIYVANKGSSNVTVINGTTNATTTVSVGNNPFALAVNPVTNRVYVANKGSNNVTVINGANNSTATVSAGTGPSAVAVNPVTNQVYVANGNSGDVTVINGANNATTTVSAGSSPAAVAVDPVTNEIYVANNTSANITVIDGASNSTITVSAGTDPDAVAVNPVTDRIYAANSGSNNVTVIDGATNSTTTVSVGTSPDAVAVNPVANKIYVVNEDGRVTVIDGTTNSTTTVNVGNTPLTIAINPVTNKIYVPNSESNNVTVIDGATNATTTVTAGSYPSDVAVNPVTNKIYVPNAGSNNVTVIDGATNATTTVSVGSGPNSVAVNPVTNKIYVPNYSSNNNVTVIDGATNATTTVSAGTNPSAVAVNPVTNKIYVANFFSKVTVIDGATNTTTTVTTGAGPGYLAINPVTNKIYVANGGSANVTVIDGATNATTTVSTGTNPDAVAVNPVTNQIYVANLTSNNVTVIDGATNATTTVSVGTNPDAVAVNPVTNQIYMLNFNGNNVTVITEQDVQPIPLQASITPQTNNKVTASTASFNFTACSSFSPIAPPPDGLYYQLDTWQGPWQAASSVSQNNFTGSLSGLLPGMHILYAYSTDGQDATSTITGYQSRPLISNIVAYEFLVAFPAITIRTLPPGLTFTVDGKNYTSSQTFDWTAGDKHTVSFAAIQYGSPGTKYQFTAWDDGSTADPRTITAPSLPTTYTADFVTQYQITTAVSPPNSGVVTEPASGTYLNAGTAQPLSATAASGFGFVNWTVTGGGALTNASSATGATVTLSGPATVTANFVMLTQPSVVSVNPNNVTGTSQTFALTYSDTAGPTALHQVVVDFNATLTYAHACLVFYNQDTNSLYLENDADNALLGPITPGSGTLSNIQCTINGSKTSISTSGNDLTVNLAVTASSSFVGTKNIYMLAQDNNGTEAGWVNEGTWTPVISVPSVVSVTPKNATGTPQTFTLTYGDSVGPAALHQVLADFSATLTYAQACLIFYNQDTNSLYLENNTDTALLGPITPGSGTLSNSQCTVNGAGTSISTSGNDLILTLALAATDSFVGKKNIYMLAQDNSGNEAGWVNEGTWTP